MKHKLSHSAATTIGFLGGGQLARMSASVLFRFGLRAAVYPGTVSSSLSEKKAEGNEKSPAEPLEWMTPMAFHGKFSDEEALLRFARQCDVITLENEFIDGEILERLEKESGTPIYPSPASFLQIDTKWKEKETFRKAGIPVVPYRKITSSGELEDTAASFGYPFVLKSSKGGYDGYGNRVISSKSDHLKSFQSLGGDKGHELVAEQFIKFKKELAVQVARNEWGTAVYPCCETLQKGHICKTVLAPAPVAFEIQEEACRLARKATEAIDGKGLFAFEFFMDENGGLLLNESAPRPHNSGHYTIEACSVSQFENHIRAVMGWPPGSTKMRFPHAVMENLLGKKEGEAVVEDSDSIWEEKETHLHIYGKEESRPGRKMGHLTLLGDDLSELKEKARRLGEALRI